MKLPPLPNYPSVGAPDRLKSPEVPAIPQARILPVQALTSVTSPQPIVTQPVRQMTQVTSPMPIQTHTNIANELALIEQTTKLAATVSKVYKEYDDQKTTYQLQDATLKLATHMQQWEMANRKETYSSFEVPGGLEGVRRTEKIPLPDGTIEERERNAIPAYEVFSKMYEREVKNAIEAFSYGVERKREKDLWVGEATVKAGQKLVETRAAELKAQDGAIRKEQESNITQAVKNSDKPLVDLLINNSNFSGPERQVLRLKSYHDLEVGRYEAAERAGTRESVEWAIGRLKDPNYYKNGGQLTESERQARVYTLEHKAKTITGTNANMVAVMNERIISDLHTDANAGKLNLDNANRALDGLLINGATHAALIEHDRQVKLRGLTDLEIQTKIVGAQARNPGTPVVTTEAGRKHLDAVFNRIAGGLQGTDWEAAAVDFAGRYFYVPQQVVSMVEAADMSGKRDAIIQAAQLYNTLIGKNATLAKDFSKERTDSVQIVASYLRAGASPDAALETIARNRSATPQQKEEYERIATRAKDAVTAKGAQSFIEFLKKQPGAARSSWAGLFDPAVAAVPEGAIGKQNLPGDDPGMTVPYSLNQEFLSSLTQNLIRTNGAVAPALDMTHLELVKRWSLTGVNGYPQAMKDAPPVDGRQMQSYLTMKYYDTPDRNGNRYSSFLLAPHPDTSNAVITGAGSVPYIVYGIGAAKNGSPVSIEIDRNFRFTAATFADELAALQISYAKKTQEFEQQGPMRDMRTGVRRGTKP